MSLQSQGPLVFSGSSDGSVCVWEVCDEAQKPLNKLQQWGSEVTGCSRAEEGTGRLRLSARGDHIFLANGRSSIRVLNWRTGLSSRTNILQHMHVLHLVHIYNIVCNIHTVLISSSYFYCAMAKDDIHNPIPPSPFPKCYL